MRALVVEDEPRLAAGLRNGLEAEGYAVDVALTGTDGLWFAREHGYDVLVLDLMLPEIDGFEICATLRAERVWTPILMLTARDADTDQVRALDTGADDYLTKPFSYAVLIARLRALVRRGGVERPTVLEAGELRMDPAARRAWRGEAELVLTARELSLLEFLIRRRTRWCRSGRSWITSGTTTSTATRTSSRSMSGGCATKLGDRVHRHPAGRRLPPGRAVRPARATG